MSVARFRRAPAAVSSLGLPVVWGPKEGRRILSGPLAEPMAELLSEMASQRGWEVGAPVVMADHGHPIIGVLPTDSPLEVAKALQGRTSPTLPSEFWWLRRGRLRLSNSYFAASVGHVSGESVRRHIEHQCNEVA
ncbi:MAG TPA: IS200/IS605 family transposase [Acidimicrobiales bacterium]|nr:IS200/IS605 family transposase [Acidimicrobiales bacterium]